MDAHEYEDEFVHSVSVEMDDELMPGAAKRLRQSLDRPTHTAAYSERESICGKKIWTPEDDAKLLELVDALGRHDAAWPEIAAAMPGRTVRSCRARWFRCKQQAFNYY